MPKGMKKLWKSDLKNGSIDMNGGKHAWKSDTDDYTVRTTSGGGETGS